MFYPLLRSLLFRFEPETAAWLSLTSMQKLARLYQAQIPNTPRTVMGIEFPNPVGLAAGLDKNADYVDGLAALGFGFIEVGTVTPRPQPGNPQPRIFRLPQAQALINRMGFNNKGVDYLLERVQQARYQGVLGINIGKNADTPAEKAVDDYLIGLAKVYPHAHYITLNISSPNTPGLRDLQYGQALRNLLAALKIEQNRLADQHDRYVPLAIKIAPDLNEADIADIAAALLEHKIDGLIATNTTSSRQGVEGLAQANATGGLSGAPLTDKATQVVAQFHKALAGQLPIIAVGGTMNADDALAKFQAGASLVQVYTGLIYRGPGLIRDIVKAYENN